MLLFSNSALGTEVPFKLRGVLFWNTVMDQLPEKLFYNILWRVFILIWLLTSKSKGNVNPHTQFTVTRGPANADTSDIYISSARLLEIRTSRALSRAVFVKDKQQRDCLSAIVERKILLATFFFHLPRGERWSRSVQTPEGGGTWGRAQTAVRRWDFSALLCELKETSIPF